MLLRRTRTSAKRKPATPQHLCVYRICSYLTYVHIYTKTFDSTHTLKYASMESCLLLSFLCYNKQSKKCLFILLNLWQCWACCMSVEKSNKCFPENYVRVVNLCCIGRFAKATHWNSYKLLWLILRVQSLIDGFYTLP